MRALSIAILAALTVACGADPEDTATSERAHAEVAPPPLPPPAPSPLARVCAADLCSGPGAIVRTWADATGVVVRYEIIDSPQCSHIAGIFHDVDGEPETVLPMPFFPPGTPDERDTITRLHDAQIAGLIAVATTTCP